MTKFPGVVIGLVINTNDPEGEGRVQLEFPWMPGSLHSSWAPIAAPMAGPSRGQFYSPEVGDEALVAFEHGDFDHPFVSRLFMERRRPTAGVRSQETRHSCRSAAIASRSTIRPERRRSRSNPAPAKP